MKLKKVASLLVAGALALSLGAMSAFADNTNNEALGSDGKVLQGNSTAGVEVAANATAIATKNLYMDPNVATPTITFTYASEKVSLDGAKDDATTGTMPAMTVGEAAIAPGSTTNYSENGIDFHELRVESTDKYKVVSQTSGITFAGDWPHAGVYVYSVKETAGSDANVTYWSKATYTVTVYVANKYETKADEGGMTPDKYTGDAVPVNLYVAAISVEKTAKEDGEADTALAKVDATGDGTPTGTQFAFKNVYEPKTPLWIEKDVTGAYADRTKEFSFDSSLTTPSTSATDTTSYTALKMKGDAQVGTETVGFTQDGTDKHLYKATYTLSDGEYLLFVDSVTNKKGLLPAGTTYTVKEALATDYTPSVQVFYANGTDTRAQPVSSSINDGVVKADNENLLAGDITNINDPADQLKANQTIVTNAYKVVTPTGILLDNLPYIIMVLVAVGGIALYLVGKKKSRRASR